MFALTYTAYQIITTKAYVVTKFPLSTVTLSVGNCLEISHLQYT